MSIFSKLFKLFLTVVLMPLIPMALLLAYYQNRQQDNILETHYNLAEIVSYNINHYTEELNWRLAFSRQIPFLSDKKQDVSALLANALDTNPDFVLLAVLDQNGREQLRVRRGTDAEPGEKIDLSADASLNDMAANPRIYLTALQPTAAAPVAEFVYPLADGRFLYGILSLYELLDRLQQMRIGRTGQVYLAAADGNLFLLPFQWQPGVNAADLQKVFESKNRFIKKLPSQNGVMVGAYASAAPLGVYITVLQPREEALRSLYFSNIVIFLFLLAIATLAYFGALTFSRSLGEPIAALAQGAREVSRGNLDHRVNEDAGWGELQQLIVSFNKMTADLKDYQALQIKNQVSEMKEQIFRSVAHDLRAPLLGLQGYIYLLSSGKATEEQKKEYLQRMKEGTQNLSSLLEDVLAVSRVQAGMTLPQRQNLSVRPLLQNVLHTIEPAAKEKNLRLELTCDQNVTAWADPKLLRRIVTNLLSNAVKFTQQGFIETQAYEENGQTVVSVRDSGKGMDEKQCREVFEKYRQVDETAEGYGLGLFISRQLARAHGGDLTVQSLPGQGSTFILRLPKEEK